MKEDVKRPAIVAVSGGFDPVHVGHIRMLREARALGDKLVVILNNDNWLMKKKGYVFIPQQERKEILESIREVDEVIITGHSPNPEDMSICRELRLLHPDVFANGGDRFLDNIPEAQVCRDIGCQTVFNVGAGGKVQSSSWLVDKLREQQRKAS